MRYEAKLFLAFDAEGPAEARAVLEQLVGAQDGALREVAGEPEHGRRVSLAIEDAQPQEVSE